MRLISEAMVSAPIVVRSGDDDEYEEDPTGVIARPGGTVMPGLTWSRLATMINQALHCGGEILIEGIGPVTGPNRGKRTSVRAWMPDQITEIKRDVNGDPTFFVVSGYQGRQRTIPAADCLYIARFDPANTALDARGQPILLGAHRSMKLTEEMDKWATLTAEHAGLKAGYFKPSEAKTTATDDQLSAHKLPSMGGSRSGATRRPRACSAARTTSSPAYRRQKKPTRSPRGCSRAERPRACSASRQRCSPTLRRAA